MAIVLLTKQYLSNSTSESKDHPKCVYRHIKKVIKERAEHIEEEYGILILYKNV